MLQAQEMYETDTATAFAHGEQWVLNHTGSVPAEAAEIFLLFCGRINNGRRLLLFFRLFVIAIGGLVFLLFLLLNAMSR